MVIDSIQRYTGGMAKRDKSNPNMPPATPLVEKPSPTEQHGIHGLKVNPEKPDVIGVKRAVHGTEQSDALARAVYPMHGDTVRVDVDNVHWLKRGAVHNAIIAAGMHGQLGTVIGSDTINSMYMLKVQTANVTMLVPADCVTLEALPEPPKAMQEPRQSPERMRKPGTGAYKLT